MDKIMLGIETGRIAKTFGEIKGLEMIRQAGFDCVDFSFYSKEMKQAYQDGTMMDYIQTVRQTMDRIGLRCNQAHAPMDFHFGQRMEMDEPNYAMLVKSMEGAAGLGAKFIVIHSILTPAGVDLVEYNVRFFRGLVPYCEKFGIQIGFENIFDYDPYRRCMPRFATPEAMNDILARIGSDWLVCCCDVGHAAIAGTMPEDFIRGMDKDILRLVHIHDTDYVDDRHMLPFIEKQNWDEITAALGEIGYYGAFSFEVGKFFAKLPPELYLSALRYAHDIGRYLIDKIEKAKG